MIILWREWKTMFPYNFAPPYDNNKVTVELRQIVESGVNVWAFDYPSYYKGEAKTAFEQKVLDHYWLRQIGQETTGRWLHYFRSRMREIMPYYIQLYESQALMHGIDDPFGNVDIVETYEEERTENSTGKLNNTNTSTSTSTSQTENTGISSGSETENATRTEDHKRKFSNTPQGSISNLDNYLTEANVETANDTDNLAKEHEATTEATSTGTASGNQTDTQTGTSEGTSTGTVRHTFTKKGNQGVNTYAHDMKELRETFLNIDLMIINELKDLFLQVY